MNISFSLMASLSARQEDHFQKTGPFEKLSFVVLFVAILRPILAYFFKKIEALIELSKMLSECT